MFKAVSGLSQLDVMQDIAAKVLCNLQGLAPLMAHISHALPLDRHINCSYLHTVFKPLLLALLLGWGWRSCCPMHWHSWRAVPTGIGTACRNSVNLIQNFINLGGLKKLVDDDLACLGGLSVGGGWRVLSSSLSFEKPYSTGVFENP